jgi:hypothetical protein
MAMTAMLSSAATFHGFGKYPLLRSHPALRNVGFAGAVVLLCASLDALLLLAVAAGCVAVAWAALVLFVSDMRFIRTVRWTSIASSTLLIIVLLPLGMSAEVRQLLKDKDAVVHYARQSGVVIPDRATDQVTGFFANYLLSENVTQALEPLITSLQTGNTTLDWSLARAAVDYVRRNGFSKTQSDLTAHLGEEAFATVKDGAIAVMKHAQTVGVALMNALFLAVSTLLAITYEVVLFYATLAYLRRQERSALFAVMRKAMVVVRSADAPSADRVIERREQHLLAQFSALFMSFWHVAVFHFMATYAGFFLAHVSYPITASAVSVVFALLPFGVYPQVPYLVPIAVNFFRGETSAALLVTAVAVAACCANGFITLLEVEPAPTAAVAAASKARARSQSKARRSKSAPDAAAAVATAAEAPLPALSNAAGDATMLSTSGCLGFVSFGVKGVVVGPMILIALQALWDAVGDPSSAVASPVDESAALPPRQSGVARSPIGGRADPAAELFRGTPGKATPKR